MKSKKAIRITALSVIALLVLALIAFQSGFFSIFSSQEAKAESNPSPANRGGNEVLAKALIAKPEKLVDRIRVSGTILPNEEVALSTEVGGVITQINFREGGRVGQGALLVKINDAELRAQTERLEAQLELYKNREYRQKKLLEKGGVSQDEYDSVLAEYNALKAQLKEVKAQLQKTEIRAPFSGTVGLRKVSLGTYVNPGTPILNLVNLDKLKIEFSVPEKYSSRLEMGQLVRISNESIDTTYQGKIYAIEPKIDLNTRTLTARALLNNPTRRLVPGAFVNIQIILKEYEEAIQVPSIALISELGGQKVFTYQNGKAIPVFVETGIRTDEQIQIVEGVDQGDTIIVSGLLNLRPDIPVELQDIQ